LQPRQGRGAWLRPAWLDERRRAPPRARGDRARQPVGRHLRRPARRGAIMTGRAAPIVTALAALLVLHLVLALPDHPRAMTPETFARLPLELPVILLALILAPRGLRLPLRLLLTGGLALMTVVKLAYHAAFLAYARGFNPLLEDRKS